MCIRNIRLCDDTLQVTREERAGRFGTDRRLTRGDAWKPRGIRNNRAHFQRRSIHCGPEREEYYAPILRFLIRLAMAEAYTQLQSSPARSMDNTRDPTGDVESSAPSA